MSVCVGVSENRWEPPVISLSHFKLRIRSSTCECFVNVEVYGVCVCAKYVKIWLEDELVQLLLDKKKLILNRTLLQLFTRFSLDFVRCWCNCGSLKMRDCVGVSEWARVVKNVCVVVCLCISLAFAFADLCVLVCCSWKSCWIKSNLWEEKYTQ